MDRKWFNNDFETCTNGDCPYCADFCPVTENQEVCRYSDLDGTETMLRRCLDTEKKDSREAIQALAEENRTLKKLYENGKSAIDTNQKLSQKICELENQLHDSYQGHLLDVVIPGLEKQLAAYKDTGLEPQLVRLLADAIRGETGVFCPVCGDELELETSENGLMIGCFGCGEYVPVKELFEVYREQAALKERENNE